MAHPRSVFDSILLEKAKKVFNEFIQKYKSSEDYYPREKYPHLTLAGLNDLADHPDVDKIIEAYIIFRSRSMIWDLKKHVLATRGDELLERRNGQSISVNASQAFPVFLTGHGECSNLAYAFLNELMTLSIPLIHVEFHSIKIKTEKGEKEYDHAMVVLPRDGDEPYVFDPFFKIHAKESAYITSEKYLNYFKRLTGNSKLTYLDLETEAIAYDVKSYLNQIDRIQSDLQFLKKEIATTIQELQIKQVVSLQERPVVFKLSALLYLFEQVLKLYNVEEVSETTFNQYFSEFQKKLEKKYPISEVRSFFEEIGEYKARDQIKVFIEQIEQENYGAALRTACTSQHHGMVLVQMMQKYPKLIPLSDLILEKNKTGVTAFHVAASKRNVKLFNFLKKILIQNQKPLDVPNAEGKTAQKVLEEVLAKQAAVSNSTLSSSASTLYGSGASVTTTAASAPNITSNQTTSSVQAERTTPGLN